jgi:hypothetical protein
MTNNAVFEPGEYYRLDEDLKCRITVKAWTTPSRSIYYEIEGAEDADCLRFFHILLKEYPENPYMTMITQRTPRRLIVSRLASSD